MTRMGWQTTGDVAGFLDVAGDFLRAERARNTVMLTVTETARLNPDHFGTRDDADPSARPLYGWWSAGHGDGAVGAAFLHTPAFPILLSAAPPAAATDLASNTLAGRPLPGVNADEDTAAVFAAAWRARTGCQIEMHRRTRLYRLARLVPPDPLPDGAPRVAAADDVPLLAQWFGEFAREVNDMGGEDHAASVRDRLSYGGLTLWEDAGTPVCLVGVTRQVARMVRVGPVYTPPDLRGRGYASAATAEVSRAAVDAGADEVLLYTDLANPVSNSIYKRIGYREVEDRVVLSFTGAGARSGR